MSERWPGRSTNSAPFPYEGLGEDVEIQSDPMGESGAYMLTFANDEGSTHIRINLTDYSGADLVITNMTTLPVEQIGSGYGSTAIRRLIAWAHQNNLKTIRAVQVQQQATGFWEKNGFVRLPEPNPTSDYEYQGE